MTLGDAAVGSTVIVAKIDGDGAYKRRIMDMGPPWQPAPGEHAICW